MSVSKLESLPNEIFIQIFEKYMNGLDIFVAFGNRLNQRFDALIAGCRGLRFDFIRCHKDDFELCIDLLTAHTDKIEELFLSEQNTPGQTRAFLSLFPFFTSFKRLYKLYFYIDAETIDLQMFESAFHSLSKISIEILSIIITNAAEEVSSINGLTVAVFCLPTLKQLFLSADVFQISWNQLLNVSSHVEYLTILDIKLDLEDFKTIFQCTPHLKYLHIQVSSAIRSAFPTFIQSPKSNIIMVKLRTVILKFVKCNSITYDTLAEHFKIMPNLRRLEINADHTLLSANDWEKLLITLLPSLLYFNLNINASLSDKTINISSTLSSFQTPFWIEKRNFNIMITTYSPRDCDKILINRFNQVESNLPVVQWWIAPLRGINDNFASLKNITRLEISTASKPLPRYYKFNNINQVIVRELDKDLLEWILTYINCSRIKSLDISLLKNELGTISSLLSRASNITTLRIGYHQYQDAFPGRNFSLKNLDISAFQHTFNEEDIVKISKLFPTIEHLVINTEDLHNVHLLKNYLPRLRSLTFRLIGRFLLNNHKYYPPETRDEKLWNNQQISFHHKENSATVWLDLVALEKPQ